MKHYLHAPMFRPLLLILALGANLFISLPALAANVALATSPLANSSAVTVAPNVMLMLDDSGSMDWDYMPDIAKNFAGKYGYNSSQCNGVYYDPGTDYTVPVDSAKQPLNATATNLPGNASFTAAWIDGYDTSLGTTNLSTQFTGGAGNDASGINLTAGPAFYYNYIGTLTGSADKKYFSTSSPFYLECNAGSAPTDTGNTKFTKVTVLSTSAEAQNFANWYSYYSTRMKMMKSGVGDAFKNLSNRFRIGYMSMNNNNFASGTPSTADFVDPAAFNGGCTVGSLACQKDKWYKKLYAATPGSSTPLREALSKVGRLYANKYAPSTTYRSTITVSGSGSTSVSSITVGGVEIMNATTSAATSTSTVATRIRDEVDVLADEYNSTRSGSTITITGPASANGSTPVITKSGSMTITPTAFAPVTVSANLNGVTPADPIQYSCQKNFVILSTDGYWNGNAGYKLDGTTAIGNQDATAVRPMKDGSIVSRSTAQVRRTSTKTALSTSRVEQTQSKTSNLQQSTSALQSSAWQLQGVPSYLQAQTSQLQRQTSTLQGTLSKVLMTCAGTAAFCGTAPTTGIANAKWTVVTGSSGSCTTVTNTQCATVSGLSGLSNVATTCNTSATITTTSASITITVTGVTAATRLSSIKIDGVEILTGTTSNTSNNNNNRVATNIRSKVGNGYTATVSTNVVTITKAGTITGSSTIAYTVSTGSATLTGSATAASTLVNADSNGNIYSACSYTAWGTATSVGSCTAVAQSTASPYTVITATQCPTTVTSAWANTGSTCTTAAADTSGISTACRYNTPTATPANVGTCTYQARSPSSPYTVITETLCSYATTPVVTATSPCTTSAKTISTANGTVYNATANTCGYSTPVTTNVSTCTPVAASTGSPYTVASSVGCGYTVWPAAWTSVNTGACTAAAQDTATYNMSATSGAATQCQTVGVSACAGGTTCATVTTGGATNYVASCTADSTPNAGNSFTTTTCATTPHETNVFVASCTSGAVGSSTPFAKTTACTPVTTGPTTVGSCVNESPTAANSYTTVTCSGGSGGTSDTLADTAMYYYQTDLRDTSLSNCTGILGAGIDVCENNVRASDGDDNNTKQHMTTLGLAFGARGKMVFSPTYLDDTSGDFYDVKMNTAAAAPICSWQSTGNCEWPAPPSGGSDPTTIDDLWHASVNGRGVYFNPTDKKELAVGLATVLKKIDSSSGAAAAAATSTLNPTSANNSAFVASYTTVKWSGNLEQRDISTATGVVSKNAGWCVENISQSTCLAPAVVVSETVDSSTNYYCSKPAADVNAPTGIDVADCTSPDVLTTVGATQVCRTPISYSCAGTMPSLVSADGANSRHIYSQAGGSLIEFKASDAAFSGTGTYAQYFNSPHIDDLSQWAALTTTQQTAAQGTNLINFVRGQYGYQENRSGLSGHTTDDWLYRFREETMGDALESQPTYIGPTTFGYIDAGYGAFATANASREGMVYIGTNDGMLHAFHAKDRITYTAPAKCVVGAVAGDYCGGEEAWAYIPSMVIPNLYKLADTSYDAKHVNFVNGSPIISDVCVSACNSSSAVWKTILVGGLNAGGRGFYALDITTPTTPAFLWEFSATNVDNLGYSYGRPIITKKQNGTWVVLITSGYDNGAKAPNGTDYSTTTPDVSGDGGGYLYVLKASDGTLLSTYPTGAGDATTPSGLAKIEAYADVTDSNQAGFVYGGDLSGNLWRFNINQPAATSATTTLPPNPFKVAELMDGTTPQPITAAPTLGKINGQRVIFVGTGQYLQPSDLTNTNQQTLYAIKDNQFSASAATLSNPRSSTSMVEQTMTAGASPYENVRTNSTPAEVDWNTKRGWFVDFLDSKERVNIDSRLIQGTLVVPTIVPADSICTPGGYGWLNYFDYKNGGPIDYATSIVGLRTDSTIVGVNVIYIDKQPIVEYVSSSSPTPTIPPPPTGGGSNTTDGDGNSKCVGADCACKITNTCDPCPPGDTACRLCKEQGICPKSPSLPGEFLNQRQIWRELIP